MCGWLCPRASGLPVYFRPLSSLQSRSSTLSNANVTIFLVFKRIICLSFTFPIFLTRPVRGQFCPKTFPRLWHLHSRFHLVLLRGSSLIPSACVDCHHLLLLHLKTLFKVSITALVKHCLCLPPMILSRVFTVHAQFLLPKEKTANTWSNCLRHLIYDGMSPL